jgi:hypothetical protein
LEFNMPWIAAGAAIAGGLLGGRSSKKAAQAQAAAQIQAAQIAAEEARFRPVGVTTRFGSSNFQTDANGRVSGADYTLDPAFRAYQDRFMGLAGGGLLQAEGAQEQFAPLGEAGQSLFNLGSQYLAQSPEEAAAQYMAGQQNLLAPIRDRQLAQLRNNVFQTGRGGLSVGATGLRPGGGLGLSAANPEMEAYYNALAQQDAALAAQSMEAGQRQTAFGAGLFGTGGNLITQGYQGQTQALGPYEAYLQQMKSLEALGQQPLDLGINIGAKGQSNTGALALLSGGTSAANSMYKANSYNPFATALIQGSQNPALRSAASSFDPYSYLPNAPGNPYVSDFSDGSYNPLALGGLEN